MGSFIRPAVMPCQQTARAPHRTPQTLATRAALRRKGKGDDVSEEDMDSVVFNHNTMNELTWQQVGAWRGLEGEAQRL